MLVVQRAAMHCVQAKLPTILTDISLKYAKLSRFLRKTQWMDVTKRVKDKRELHHVTKRKCCLFFSVQYLEAWRTIKCRLFLPVLFQQHLLSPQRAPERLLQLAQENLDTLVTEMDELLTRVSLWSHWGLWVWLKLHNDRIWIKHVWIDEL